ncbi:MAG: glycosyltransferase, partial [Ilumatobacter fluminis]
VRIRAPKVPGMGGYRMIVRRKAVRDALDRLAPDVIELSDKATLVGPAADRRADGARVVLISHERLDAIIGRATRMPNAVAPAVRRYDARLLRRVDAVVCASDFAASEFDGLAGPPIGRIALGVDLERFRPVETDDALRAGTRLVSAVRLSPEKSPTLLVETARYLVAAGLDFEWDVYGDGPLRAELTAHAEGLPIRFLGHLADRAALAAAMATADLGIAPGRYETFGLAALEFLAAGTPVVVPEHGALAEIVPPEAGRRCPPDAAGFGRGVLELLAIDRDDLRRAARRHAEAHGWEATAERLLALYEPAAA